MMIRTTIVLFVWLFCAFPVTPSGDPFWRDPVIGAQGWATLEEVDDTRGDLDDPYDIAICRTLRCKKGEECVVKGRVAVCQCRRSCPHHDRPVCASDGVTYVSHCHLHRQACIGGIKLHILRHSPCVEEIAKEDDVRELPVLFPNSSSVDNGSAAAATDGLVEVADVNAPSTTVAPSTKSIGSSSSPSVSVIPPTARRRIPTTVIENPSVTLANEPVQLTTVAAALNSGEPAICTSDDFFYVPSNLLLYFHAKYAESTSSGGSPSEKGKSYLVHLMYNHFDLNADQILSSTELHRLDEEGKYGKLLPTGCRLADILVHADNDGDGRLDEREFFRLFGLPVAFISPHNEIKVHRVEVGQQYQLFCDIEKYNSASLKVTWYRYDVPLVNVAPYDFEVSADGSLYLTPVSLTHNGNFTCRVPIAVTSGGASSTSSINSDLSSNALQQVHVVNVFERPRVAVTPDFLLLKTGEHGYLQCDVDGYPIPKITWDKNGRSFRDNVSVLELSNVRSYDTGSYRCGVAAESGLDTPATTSANGGGSGGLDAAYRSASVVVRDHYDQPEVALRFNTRHTSTSFFILHESGIGLYRADDCTMLHGLHSSYPVNEEKQGYLCRDRRCQWSDAVVTRSSAYLYAALGGTQMALVKINVTSGLVEQFFHLNHIPMRLRYLDEEDSVWIEGWHETDGNYRTVQVVRSASKPMRHTLTHALPLRDEFDAVHRIFLPSSSSAGGRLKYGYVTHWRERALHKIDLHTLKIVSRVSLVPYDCQPIEMAFIAQVGLAVVQCSPGSFNGNRTGTGGASSGGGQLILDYISDATLGYDPEVHGVPVVTEDGRYIVNIDTVLGRIFVHRVEQKGGPLVATIDEFLPITDWTLHPSTGVHGAWTLYAAPVNGANLIKINIPDAKIDRMSLTTSSSDTARGDKPFRVVSTSRRNRYLAAATSDTVYSVDLFNSNSLECQIKLNGTQKIVWASTSQG